MDTKFTPEELRKIAQKAGLSVAQTIKHLATIKKPEDKQTVKVWVLKGMQQKGISKDLLAMLKPITNAIAQKEGIGKATTEELSPSSEKTSFIKRFLPTWRQQLAAGVFVFLLAAIGIFIASRTIGEKDLAPLQESPTTTQLGLPPSVNEEVSTDDTNLASDPAAEQPQEGAGPPPSAQGNSLIGSEVTICYSPDKNGQCPTLDADGNPEYLYKHVGDPTLPTLDHDPGFINGTQGTIVDQRSFLDWTYNNGHSNSGTPLNACLFAPKSNPAAQAWVACGGVIINQ